MLTKVTKALVIRMDKKCYYVSMTTQPLKPFRGSVAVLSDVLPYRRVFQSTTYRRVQDRRAARWVLAGCDLNSCYRTLVHNSCVNESVPT